VFEIGASLREARLRQGLDFPEIETGTKIRPKYLRALEDEQFDVLPGDTYIKGFLRTYAEYLGLDGQLYVDEFNSRYVMPEELPPIRVHRTARARRQRQVQTGVLVAALLGIAVVTALVIAAWTSGSSKQQLAGLSSTTTKDKPKHARARVHHANRARITLRAVRSNVLLIAVRKGGPRGKILVEGVELAPRESERFRAERVWVNTGTPANLRVIVNGRRARYPGGKPQAFYVTAQGVSASA